MKSVVEKKFFLESQYELHRIGLRAQIVSHLILEGVKKGNVLNDLENKKRVIVAIQITHEPQNPETEVEKIESIKISLVNYLNSLKATDDECYNQYPADISATDLTELNNPYPVDILNLTDISAALMLEQTSKGVGAMLSMKTGFTILATEFRNLAAKLEPLAKLPQILEKLKKG